jgi:hypothetical protein
MASIFAILSRALACSTVRGKPSSMKPLVEEALAMVREVIPGFVDVLREDGKPVPPDKPDVRLNMRDSDEVLVCKVTVGEEVAVA